MPLRDHAELQERRCRERTRRKLLPGAWGEFIAALMPWSWFVTITFKNGAYGCAAPPRDLAIERIEEWLTDLQAAAGGNTIGWVLAEEFGRQGGRWHCHLLISGVSHLSRRFWWQEAFRRFGRTRIDPFNRERGAAFYTAKYAAKALGEIRLGGFLGGCELNWLLHSPNGQRHWEDALAHSSPPCHTHDVVVPSDFISQEFFHLSLRRRHR